ncbi:MAG: CoA transferase subunit A [Promethearchaeota archaeon]
MAKSNKFVSLHQLVRDHIFQGNQIYLEGLLVNRLPMAAVHEIIRAELTDLRIVSAPNSVAVDQLIGAGVVLELEFYFLGFMTANGFATMRRFREAVETGKLKVKESMGYAICMALRAGAFGIPFMPLPDFRGSDLVTIREDYRIMQSPYDERDSVITVPALCPDVLLLHAHAADSKGNVYLDEPCTNFTRTTAQACKRVLVTVEELIEPDTYNPSQVTIPHFLVDAIAIVPHGAAPTALNRRYEIDIAHLSVYQEKAQTKKGFEEYLHYYIQTCFDHSAFLAKTGLPPPWGTTKAKQKKREGSN